MQNGSSGFVKIRYLDRDAAFTRLNRCATALKASNPRVADIRLFGSLVRGDYVPGSDADVLILLSNDDRRMMDRIPEFLEAFSGLSIDVDCFPITRKELDAYLEGDNPFWRRVMRESIPLGVKSDILE